MFTLVILLVTCRSKQVMSMIMHIRNVIDEEKENLERGFFSPYWTVSSIEKCLSEFIRERVLFWIIDSSLISIWCALYCEDQLNSSLRYYFVFFTLFPLFINLLNIERKYVFTLNNKSNLEHKNCIRKKSNIFSSALHIHI